jgi:lipocalin
MKLLITIAFACLALQDAVAQISPITPGPCPAVKPIANFDMNKFKGKWYEVSKTADLGDGKCVSVTFQPNANNVTVTLSFTGKDGKAVSFNGPAATTSTPGVWTMDFPGPEKKMVSAAYTILDTDYTTYASVFACGAAGANSFQIGFGFIRKLPLNDKVKASVNGAFTKSKLTQLPNIVTNQAGCV